MRILIDLQGYQSEASRNRGIGRYTRDITKAICLEAGDHEVMLALNGCYPETINDIVEEFTPYLPKEKIIVWEPIRGVNFWHDTDHATKKRIISEKTREIFFVLHKPDVVLVSSIVEATGDAVTSIGHFSGYYKTATIVYDLIPLINEKTYLADHRIRKCYLSKINHIQRSDVIFGISQHTCHEVIDKLSVSESCVFNIDAGCDAAFRQIPEIQKDVVILRRHSIHKPFVLYTASMDERKNLNRLFEAWSLLPSDLRSAHQLVIVCSLKDYEMDEINNVLNKYNIVHDVILTGHVSDEELVQFYNQCTLFVFPSWYEGFGLPVLEAMSCGAPTIGSNCSSIPEIIGKDNLLFNPYNPKEIALKIKEYLVSSLLREKASRDGLERSGKFSWRLSAKKVWDSLNSISLQKWEKEEADRNKLIDVLVHSIGDNVKGLPAEDVYEIAQAIKLNFNNTRS